MKFVGLFSTDVTIQNFALFLFIMISLLKRDIIFEFQIFYIQWYAFSYSDPIIFECHYYSFQLGSRHICIVALIYFKTWDNSITVDGYAKAGCDSERLGSW